MSTTKIVHGYRSKSHHEIMVTSLVADHAKDNLLRLLRDAHPVDNLKKFKDYWEYFTMEVEFPDGSNLGD